MALESPKYTQVPNALLGNIQKGNCFVPGLMAELSGAELKIFLAVARVTLGYHQESRRVSLKQMMILTGLTKQGILKAAQAIEERELIQRFQDGGITEWQLQVVNSVDQVVNSVDQVVNSVDQVVNSVDQGGKLSLPPSKKETEKETKKETYMPSNDGASDFSFSSGDQPVTNGKKNLSAQEQDELLLFGLYGHQQAPPAGSFAEELENSGWVLRSNIVADALEAFLMAGRAAGLALPIPNSDSRRKDWYKSLSGQVDDWGLESLQGGRYRAVFALAKEGDWLNRIGRPGAIDKALGMVENETTSPAVRNEDGSYNF